MPQNEDLINNESIEEPKVLPEEDSNKVLSPIPEVDNLLMSFNWEQSDEKIKDYKDRFLFDNKYITIGECLEEESDFVNWKYAEKDNIEYLLADYFSNGNIFQVVFEFESKKEVNITELYMNEEKQDIDGIYEYYDFTFSWRENVASFGDSYIEDATDYNFEYEFMDDYYEFDYDEYEVSDIEVFSPTKNVEYDSAYYSEETGIWLVGNTMSNGKPFKIEGIEYLYLEDGYLYFMGSISNSSSKDYYSLELFISIRNKDGATISSYTSDVFVYDKSVNLTRSSNDNLVADRFEVENIIPANGTANFTIQQFDIFNKSISDNINIRSWTVEPHYIYVTVNDY